MWGIRKVKTIEISPVQESDYRDLATMVGELLSEIMVKINEKVFNFNAEETEKRARALSLAEKYWVFIARSTDSDTLVGFMSLYESYALYAEGAFGTIPELYVRSEWRSSAVGSSLLTTAKSFAVRKSWTRLEVTTPPLPEFERTLKFYQENGFKISGGRKLVININH
jgi:GNAT superfamily N-acetyltransferase